MDDPHEHALATVPVVIEAFCSAEDDEPHPWYGCDHQSAPLMLADAERLAPHWPDDITEVTAYFPLDVPLSALKTFVDRAPDGFVQWSESIDSTGTPRWAVMWSTCP